MTLAEAVRLALSEEGADAVEDVLRAW